jgi:hypothetical protein
MYSRFWEPDCAGGRRGRGSPSSSSPAGGRRGGVYISRLLHGNPPARGLQDLPVASALPPIFQTSCTCPRLMSHPWLPTDCKIHHHYVLGILNRVLRQMRVPGSTPYNRLGEFDRIAADCRFAPKAPRDTIVVGMP